MTVKGRVLHACKQAAKRALPPTWRPRIKQLLRKGLHHLRYSPAFSVVRILMGACFPSSGISPTISVIVPVYNHSRYLTECLESLEQQSYPRLEFLIIDDGSTDPAVTEILQKFANRPRFRVMFNGQNCGITTTLNRGIMEATGNFVAFLDCDDRLDPRALSVAAREIARYSQADYFFTDRLHISANGETLERVTYGGRPDLIGVPHAEALLRTMYASHLKIVRRETFQRLGLLDAAFNGCQDYDFALRVAEAGELRYIPLPLYHHRWHPESVTLSQNSKQQRISGLVLRQAMRRRYLKACKPGPAEQPEKLVLLYVIPYLVVGGAEEVLYQLVSQVTTDPAVAAVHVFCESARGAWWSRFEALPKTTLYFQGGDDVPHEPKLEFLKELVRTQRINTLHISNSQLGYKLAAAVHAMGPRPFVVDTVHSDRSGFIPFSEGVKHFIDHRVAVCKAAKFALAARTNESRFRTHVIYNGTVALLPTLAQEEARRQWNIHSDAPVITFIGRLAEEKGIQQLPAIARLVQAQHPQAMFLLLGDGPMRAPLEQVLQEAGLSHVFRFAGESAQVADALAISSALLIPSKTEGHPMVLIEAMRMGIPVVASAVGGIPEALGQGRLGTLVPAEDCEGFAASLNHIMQEPESARRKAQRAQKLAASRFSAERMARSYMSLYRRGLARGLSDGQMRLTSIVILSFNRYNALKRCIESIEAHTRLPYELIILDNGSSHQATLEYCRELAQRPNVKVLFEANNHGCSIGRKLALAHAKGDYLVTLDNDIEVTPGWMEALILRAETDRDIAGACAKVVNPNGRIEFNGGDWELAEPFVRFKLLHNGLEANAIETQENLDCAWIPGGATLIKREAALQVEHSEEFPNAFEDNDYALQLRLKGFRLVNCPRAVVIHHHRRFMTPDEHAAEQEYVQARERKATIYESMVAFYRRNQLVIDDPALYAMLERPDLMDRTAALAHLQATQLPVAGCEMETTG